MLLAENKEVVYKMEVVFKGDAFWQEVRAGLDESFEG